MTRKALWKVSVFATPEADEAVTEQLQDFFSAAAVSYSDAETAEVVVSVYLPGRPGQFRKRLRTRLSQLRSFGINPGPCRIRLQRIRAENWAHSWKRHFKPIEIRPSLLIKPSWSRRRRKEGQVQIVLDPGLSFGTGQHPTTAFCLKQLAAVLKEGRGGAFLDMGTGSGILALAAAKLGYAPVAAFDFDAEAVRAARANARRNGLQRRIEFFQADLTKLPCKGEKRYGVICANLTADLLISERSRIVSRLRPTGVLVLAGILAGEFPRVRRAFSEHGLRLENSRKEKEWCSGAFRFSESRCNRT